MQRSEKSTTNSSKMEAKIVSKSMKIGDPELIKQMIKHVHQVRKTGAYRGPNGVPMGPSPGNPGIPGGGAVYLCPPPHAPGRTIFGILAGLEEGKGGETQTEIPDGLGGY